MPYLFTSESVSEGHPDKVSDQISDALIDHFLAYDANSKVACETLVTTGQVVLAGEVKSNAYLDVQSIARDVITKIGYTKSDSYTYTQSTIWSNLVKFKTIFIKAVPVFRTLVLVGTKTIFYSTRNKKLKITLKCLEVLFKFVLPDD